MPDLPPPTPPYVLSVPAVPHNLTLGFQMATVSDSGEVRIDWAKVEAIAAAPEDAWHDGVSKRIAQMLLAVRDGTYQPLQKRARGHKKPSAHRYGRAGYSVGITLSPYRTPEPAASGLSQPNHARLTGRSLGGGRRQAIR